MHEQISAKLGIDKRSIDNIIKNKELCDRILNEDVISVTEYIKQSGLPASTIKNLVVKQIISSFSNKNNRGSKTFIFINEITPFEKIEYKASILPNLKNSVDLYLLICKQHLTEREYNIMRKFFADRLWAKQIAIEENYSDVYIHYIINKVFRRLNHNKDLNLEYKQMIDKVRRIRQENHYLQKIIEKCTKEEPDETRELLRCTELFLKRIKDFDLSIRVLNVLEAIEIDTIGELVACNKNDFYKYRNLGRKSIKELDDFVISLGLRWGMNISHYKLTEI